MKAVHSPQSRDIDIRSESMCPEPNDLTYLVLGPASATRDSAGRIDGHVESASDGSAIVKSERNVGIADASRDGSRRSEVTNIVIGERCVTTRKLGNGSGEASGRIVQDLVDGERGCEAPSGSGNRVDESFGSVGHW